MIGINNRNLDTGVVDIQTTYDLITDVPTGTTVVLESGISNREELVELERVGVDALIASPSCARRTPKRWSASPAPATPPRSTFSPEHSGPVTQVYDLRGRKPAAS